MTEGKKTAIVAGVLGSLVLWFFGAIVGFLLSDFLLPVFPTVFIVPLALIVGVASLFIKSKMGVVGKTMLYSGIIASVALPFILPLILASS
jgi:hypothetical protein